MTIAVTGSTGLIGTQIISLLSPYFNFIPFTSQNLDITNSKQVTDVVSKTDFEVFVHLAGYTNVDQAETERELAFEINVTGTKNLYEAVLKKNKKFIYFSTDFVFDGINPPYNEKSTPHPLGYYAQTKYEGEKVITDNNAAIIRISYPYAPSNSSKPDFVHRIKSLLEQGKELTMIHNGAMTPTYIDDIAFGLKDVIENDKRGVIHLVGAQSHSPYEVGQMIAEKYGFQGQIKPISYAEYSKNKAPRPQYAIIETIQNNFYPMKSFGEGLKKLA